VKFGGAWHVLSGLRGDQVSIPRNFRVDISVRGDELRREDLAKIKSQFNRWIERLEEAFEE
jgi:hypothetical protein